MDIHWKSVRFSAGSCANSPWSVSNRRREELCPESSQEDREKATGLVRKTTRLVAKAGRKGCCLPIQIAFCQLASGGANSLGAIPRFRPPPMMPESKDLLQPTLGCLPRPAHMRGTFFIILFSPTSSSRLQLFQLSLIQNAI